MDSILQWNCNGYYTRFEDLKVLLATRDPLCICLQETHFRDTQTVSHRGYTLYRKDAVSDVRAKGGVAILVRETCYSQPIPIVSELQVVAARVAIPSEVTLCSIYFPPDESIPISDLVSVLDQLPSPFILLGDFNAHCTEWGSTRVNRRGRQLERVFSDLHLTVLNTGSNTHYCVATGSHSAIDLTVCTASLATLFEWQVHDDLCGSDHFPIFLRVLGNTIGDSRSPKWILKRADWPAFSENVSFVEESFSTVDEQVAHFTEVVTRAAGLSVPKSSGNVRRVPVPWWNEECECALRERKRAFCRFDRYPTVENKLEYLRLKAKARKIMRISKKESWRHYVSSVNSSTPTSKVWEKVRRIHGKTAVPIVSGLMVDGRLVTTRPDIADALASSFAEASSDANLPRAFASRKREQECRPVLFRSLNCESYNSAFSDWELGSALSESRDTSPGPDDIHYQFLKNLSMGQRAYLLRMLNHIWSQAECPAAWRESIVIPILKPGKDRQLTSSYRPVSLTSCICKTLERMINRRLVWFLESNGLLANIQCGFRRHRSTVDHLVRLEAAIQDAFVRRQHLVAVFFDLQKAYDTAWRHGILRQMHAWGFRGRLPQFVESFMSTRTFRVRVGNVLSRPFSLENGVPQGSILSVTLFAVAVNGLAQCVRSPVEGSLYVDDLAIYCRAGNINVAERQLQLTINRVHRWATDNGLTFSASKTKCVHFCRLRTFHPDPVLTMGGNTLPFEDSARFLGLLFDRKLTWRPHVLSLRANCQSALNLLRVLGGQFWGADRTVMLRLYRSLVRSKLDYGCVAYSSARSSVLGLLNTVHHAGIRIATGAFRTSPVSSLLCESGEPSLHMRRKQLALCYVASLSAKPDHPTYGTVFRPRHLYMYGARPRTTRPLVVRVIEHMRNRELLLPRTHVVSFGSDPPWTCPRPVIDWSLASRNKADTLPAEYLQAYHELLTAYAPYTIIYTDGSKSDGLVGSAFVVGERTFQFRLSALASVYTAELYAIFRALRHLEVRGAPGPFAIFSDSMSALKVIQTFNCAHPLVQKIQSLLLRLTSAGGGVRFVWIPGHVGIIGNERADAAAKAAAEKASVDMSLVHVNDLQAYFKRAVQQEWQEEWDRTENNKLRHIKATVRPWVSSRRASRREEVILTRLRIGHCYLTHGFLLRGEEPPICADCGTAVTVPHLLLNCVVYRNERERAGLSWDLPIALGDDPTLADRVLLFLRESRLLSLI